MDFDPARAMPFYNWMGAPRARSSRSTGTSPRRSANRRPLEPRRGRPDQDPGRQGDRRRRHRRRQQMNQLLEQAGTSARRSAGTWTTRRRSRRPSAPCCPTGCRPPPGRSSTSTAAPHTLDCPEGDGAVGHVDALLLLSFGGPESPDHVRPFLENVTRGRGVPPERLDEVAEHYLHFGGVSPINASTATSSPRVESELAGAESICPSTSATATGIRWSRTPSPDARRRCRSALVFPTSAWGGYSGCRQYHEDVARARAAVGDGAPDLVKLRQYYDHPLLDRGVRRRHREPRRSSPPSARRRPAGVHRAFGAGVRGRHAAPPADGGHLYSRQVAEAARLVARGAGFDDFDLVWQSRSGPAQVPWLEPDICDHLTPSPRR